jgi:exopolyphosphatase / guanosine-5'-triphosphate,3'-diphosphate pyrophosphatase
MESKRRAVIDVGTNSIKLLVAEAAGDQIVPILETSHQTRLGQGFYRTQRLQAGPIASSVKAVSDFAERARKSGAVSVRVIATSAVRDALNAQDLTSAIEQSSGLKVEVISGEQEADWGFRGVSSDPKLASAPLCVVDVGGGSSEFILGQHGHKEFSRSYDLGTVRLLELVPHGDPPGESELAACRDLVRDFLAREVQPSLGAAMAAGQGWQLIGCGGTASILGCMEARLTTFDRERLESTRLSLQRLSWHTTHLWSLSLAQRQQVAGLPRNRADVILTGVVIYETFLEQFGFAELCITTRGLRFAALM